MTGKRGYRCGLCEELHFGLPEIAFSRPDTILALTPTQRERCFESDDGCVIPPGIVAARALHFLRGVLPVPIKNADEPDWAFGPWASVNEQDFERVICGAAGELIAPFPGHLATRLPGFETNFGCALLVEPRDNTLRPTFRCADQRTRLAASQRDGIRVQDVLRMLHQFGS